MIRLTIKSLFVLVICSNAIPVFSQSMNSPYSVYGIGDIDNNVYNRTSGMAGASLAIQSPGYIINTNPAAITGLQRSFLVVNIMGAGKTSTYKGDPITSGNNKAQDFWIKGFSVATKINKFWASNVGISQFSNVSYKFSGNRMVEGSTDIYSSSFEGEGGLNEYYWNNAVALGKHFSFGVRSSMIAGSIDQKETVYDDALQSTIVTAQKDYFGDLRFQYGGLYKTSLGKNWGFSFGGRYSAKTNLSSERTLTVTENDASVVDERFIKADRFILPQTFAAGFAFTHKQKTTFAVDYTHENWSVLKVKGAGWHYTNSDKVSAGVEFSKLKQQWNTTTEKKYYQLGVFYNNPYLVVKNTPIKEYGLTAGMGGRLGNNLLYGLSGQFGVRGTTVNNLVKENYFQFTFTLSYMDFLFSKGRRYN
jgi:hypothetical protein